MADVFALCPWLERSVLELCWCCDRWTRDVRKLGRIRAIENAAGSPKVGIGRIRLDIMENAANRMVIAVDEETVADVHGHMIADDLVRKRRVVPVEKNKVARFPAGGLRTAQIIEITFNRDTVMGLLSRDPANVHANAPVCPPDEPGTIE